MRSFAVAILLMAPCLARASSVLLVPDDDAARAVTAELGDAFSAAKLTVKTAPPGSPAVTCLGDADRVGCLSTIGEKAKVVGVFVVSGGLKGSKGSLNLELIAGGKVIKKSTTKISKGEGSLGAIINDPTVYEDLKEILGNVKRNRILRELVRYSISNSEQVDKAGKPVEKK